MTHPLAAALLVHIAGGSLAIAAGALALTVRKGGAVHRVSGFVFVCAMAFMSLAASWLSLTLPDWANLPGGIFALYLVVSGWAAARRVGRLRTMAEQGGLVLGGGAAALAALLGFQANASATGLISGKPAPLFFILAALAVFALLQDIRALSSTQVELRIGRHIWRMCTALFIGAGSFFLGQQKVMPVWLQGSPLWFVLALAPLGAMVFWLVRTAVRRTPRLAEA